MGAKTYIGVPIETGGPGVARLVKNIYIGVPPDIDTGLRRYNGIELPALSETELSYSCILEDESGYLLYCSDKSVVYADGMKFSADTSVEIYSASPGDSEWHFDGAATIVAGTVKAGDIVWSSYDIYLESTDDTDAIFENGILYIKSANATQSGNILEVK